MAADGRSFITSVGSRQSSVWIHDGNGTRQLSLEGFSFDPKITHDGRRLCYRVLKGALPTSDPSELRVIDIASGHDESLLPGFSVVGIPRRAYDISPDGQQVVVTVLDQKGKHRLWIVPFDRQLRPHQIPNVEGDHLFFGVNGEIFFRGLDGNSSFAYRVREDGSGLQKVVDQPVAGLAGLTPDGQWLVAKVPGPSGSRTLAVPIRQRSAVRVVTAEGLSFADTEVRWSADARSVYLRIPVNEESWAAARTYGLPLAPGSMWPNIPREGFRSETEIANAPGAVLLNDFDAPGPRTDVYAFSRMTVQRNLFRIPLR